MRPLLALASFAAFFGLGPGVTASETAFRLGKPYTYWGYGDGKDVCVLAMRFKGQINESESYSFLAGFQLKPRGEQWAGDGYTNLHGSLVANKPEGRFVMLPKLDLYGRREGHRRVSYQRNTWEYLATRRWIRVRAKGWIETDTRPVWSGSARYRLSAKKMRSCSL
jgi:hypothetical protein